ncbi:MAG: hypothetical protein J6X49_08910, partial [Victivallales bacterium]|nr:hypothetical protein [Victivallales bacterium]
MFLTFFKIINNHRKSNKLYDNKSQSIPISNMKTTLEKHEIPRLLAHRGAAEAATENGLLAFKYAIENGITGFETDFRLTADGEVVV